jgi:diaminohydroxyphosphoribosylaminopyrimidine deaminase / 5-amino-6-(5-phosphoribosylamino)uracil reductase
MSAPMPATTTDQDRLHLRRALDLAEGGRGRVSPNPLVGAVIVSAGAVIGEGFHAELGDLHAERAALEDCRRRGEDPAGATMYVTLEPCAHRGRQPPCAEAIVEAGIARVVVGSDDPSERASGRGPGILRDEGIEVEFADGAEAAAARLLIQPFRKLARTGRPLVTLKSALTLDGRTATAAGDSKWISSAASRLLVHRWRSEADAVAIGIGTALADDPLLTAREVDAPRQPARIVFDSHARLPADSRLVRTVAEAPLVVVSSNEAPEERRATLREAGADVLSYPGDRQARIASALDELGRRRLSSLLLEGGAGLAGSFLDAGEIDEFRLFIAPIVLGGSESRPLAGGYGADSLAHAQRALAVESEPSGDDLLIRARLREW